MVLIFAESDNSDQGTCGVSQGCAPAATATVSMEKFAAVGGTLGSTEFSGLFMEDGGITRSTIMFEMEPVATDWASGTAIVRLDVTTGNMQVQWTAVYLCQRTAGCGEIAEYGSATGLGIALTTAQVYSQNVTVSAITAATSDILFIVLEFTAQSGMAQTIGITPSQNIDTPINTAGLPDPDVGTWLRRYQGSPTPNTLVRM
jgi:hypothetical protein